MLFEYEISDYNPNTPDTNCQSIFLIKKKIIGAQNQIV